jgi:hypothetical protein
MFGIELDTQILLVERMGEGFVGILNVENELLQAVVR